jgi:drug/metabolite transporter (DMT)-like permease
MKPELIALVILAAALHAGWNLLSKRAAAAGASFVLAYRLFSAAFYAPWVIYVLWIEGMAWSPKVAAFIALSCVLHLGYSLCLSRGYQRADLSVIYPIARGTGPLLSSLAAFAILGETATLSRVAGIVTVVCGILLIATQANLRQFSSPQAWVGVRWGLLTGLFIACYSVTDAYTVQTLMVAPVVLDWFSSAGAAALMAPRAIYRPRRFLDAMKGYWRLAMFVGLLSPMAYILVLYALQQGASVSLVAPLRETSMMLATVAGFIILKEKVSAARWMGCVLIVAGAIFLTR